MTFQTFTGKEYLKIDIANSFGLDKLPWDERIAWFDENEHQLMSLMNQAEEPALFYAGVKAWEDTKAGLPSGYPISLDATCSGIQILAALSGDRKAAAICNVIDVGTRADAYTSIFRDMVDLLQSKSDDQPGNNPQISREETKRAIMTAFYGSTEQPKKIFGKDELLNIFYEVMEANAPGPWEITKVMLAIWDKTATKYEWVLPDNFHVKFKVEALVEETIHFLNEPHTVVYREEKPTQEGRSLGANMTHSIDGMIVREMVRRCSYDPAKIEELSKLIRRGAAGRSANRPQDKMVQLLWQHYEESGFLSARILDYLDIDNLGLVDTLRVIQLINSLPAKPFQVISVHDCFRCLPNYGNDLRRQYNNLLAEIAESDLLSFIVSQILKRKITVDKLDTTLADDIRQANYALS